jgi:hypothetical protein
MNRDSQAATGWPQSLGLVSRGGGLLVETLIIGRAPDLAGKRCDAIVCQQFRYRGELAEPANVVHLQFDGSWHRLSIDCGVVFWGTERQAPRAWSVEEEGWDYPLEDLGSTIGLVGACLRAYEMEPSPPDGARVVFHFEGGHRLAFENVDDRTCYLFRRADRVS